VFFEKAVGLASERVDLGDVEGAITILKRRQPRVRAAVFSGWPYCRRLRRKSAMPAVREVDERHVGAITGPSTPTLGTASPRARLVSATLMPSVGPAKVAVGKLAPDRATLRLIANELKSSENGESR
jgi:hypothetical protein